MKVRDLLEYFTDTCFDDDTKLDKLLEKSLARENIYANEVCEMLRYLGDQFMVMGTYCHMSLLRLPNEALEMNLCKGNPWQFKGE